MQVKYIVVSIYIIAMIIQFFAIVTPYWELVYIPLSLYGLIGYLIIRFPNGQYRIGGRK